MKVFFFIPLGLIMVLGALFLTYWLMTYHSNGKITSGGRKRRFILYVPKSYNPAIPTPLVISMHGFGDWPAHHMYMSGWNKLADEQGILVVYPMGTHLPLRWQLYDSNCSEANPTADIRFISDLIDHLEKHFNLDPSRIYANGLSNGGGMAHALACALPERIAAVGCVAGAYGYPLAACQPGHPVPMLAFHGTADAIVPYHGGPSTHVPYPLPNLPEFIRQIAEQNGCGPLPHKQLISQHVHSITYTGCTNEAEVILYTILGGGHTWPGGKRMPHFLVGETNHEIDATRILWDFYQMHRTER